MKSPLPCHSNTQAKARRRTPSNWQDFETHTIRLAEDRWTSQATTPRKAAGKLAPARKPFYDALVAAIGKSPVGTNSTTLPTWELECLRRGLIERPPPDGEKENWQQRGSRDRNYRKAKSDLLAAG